MKEKERFIDKFANTNIINYVVFIVIMAVFIFNGYAFYRYYKSGIMPPTELIIGFNGFCGVELIGTTVISATSNLGGN